MFPDLPSPPPSTPSSEKTNEQQTVGLRVPPNEEEAGMDRTRHSFVTNGGSGPGERGKHGSYSAGQGSDAVRRAVIQAQWGFVDEATQGAQGAHVTRSQQSSRAGSLTASKVWGA